MKSMEEFRATVYEKAERYKDEQRRNRRGVMRVSMLSLLCIGIALSVFLGNVMRDAFQNAPDEGTGIPPTGDETYANGTTACPSGQEKTEAVKSSDPKESTAATVLTLPARETTPAWTWSVETTGMATFPTSSIVDTVPITSSPPRTVFLTDEDVLLETDSTVQEWKRCFSDRASLLSFFGKEREADLAEYTDGFFAEHDLYAIWFRDAKPISYTVRLLRNGEWSFVISPSETGEAGRLYLFFAPVERPAD